MIRDAVVCVFVVFVDGSGSGLQIVVVIESKQMQYKEELSTS